MATSLQGTWPISFDAGTLACDAIKGDHVLTGRQLRHPHRQGDCDELGAEGGWKNFREIWLTTPATALLVRRSTRATSPKASSSVRRTRSEHVMLTFEPELVGYVNRSVNQTQRNV